MNKLLSIFLTFTLIIPLNSFAIPKDADKAHLESHTNLLENPGFESGKAKWTATGSSTIALETSSPIKGKTSLKWDPSATGEFLDSTLSAITTELEGNLCQSRIKYLWDTGVTGDITLEVHNGTNSITAPVDLIKTSGIALWVTTPIYSCPTTGSMKLRLASIANTAEITLDKAHLGEALDVSQVGSSEQVAHASYAGTTNCIWTHANTSFTDFPTDADCPAVSVIQSAYAVNTADNNLPDLVFDSLPPGVYKVIANLTSANSGGAAGMALRISDGTTNGTPSGFVVPASVSTVAYNMEPSATFTYSISGARTFKMQGLTTSANIQIRNDSTVNNSLTWTVTRYPLNSSEAFNLNTQRFLINANIEGGNLILGTVPVSAYAEIVNAGLSMTINEGSKPAEIPCSATNPSTGLTCSAGNEGLGVVIPNLPYAGRFEVCAAFGHQINLDSTDTLVSYFQWIETPNDAQTVLQTGKVRQPSGINNVSTAGLQREDTLPVSICGEFEFNSAGKKTLRLMYTQETAGTPVSSVILADGASGSQGDRDFHVTVKSLTQGFPLPFIFNTVTTSNQNGESIHTAKISQGAGTCAVDSQRGTWISSISTFGAGFCDLTVDAAICDINVTSCQATCQSADNTPSLNVTGGKIRVGCDTGAAGQNSIRHVNCMCKKQ